MIPPPSVIVIPRSPGPIATSTTRLLSRRQSVLSLRRRDFLPEADDEDRRAYQQGEQRDDDDYFLGTFACISDHDAKHHDDLIDDQVTTLTPPQRSRIEPLPNLMHRCQQTGAISERGGGSVYIISTTPSLSHLAAMLIPPKIVIDDERQRRKTAEPLTMKKWTSKSKDRAIPRLLLRPV
jgi:hypothetical protein